MRKSLVILKLRRYQHAPVNYFYLTQTLFACGASALGLFLPIYFYQNHIPVSEIFLFFALNSAIRLLLMRPMTRLTVQFGASRLLAAAIALFGLFYCLLSTMPLTHGWLLFFALLFGVANALYWTNYHLFLAIRGQKEKIAKEKPLPWLKNIANAANMAGPALSAITIVKWGFPIMFSLSALFMLAAMIPLLFAPYVRIRHCPTWREIFRGRHAGEIAALSLGFGSESYMQNLVWPLYVIATGLMGILGLGTLSSIGWVVMFGLSHLIGWAADRWKDRVLIIGAIGSACINLFRARGIATRANSLLLTLSGEVCTDTATLPIDALCYHRAQSDKIPGSIAAYILFREALIHAGSIFFFLLAAWIRNFNLLFLIGSSGALLYILFLKTGRIPQKARA